MVSITSVQNEQKLFFYLALFKKIYMKKQYDDTIQLIYKLDILDLAEIRGSIKFLLEKEKYKKNLKSKKIYLIKNYIKEKQ